MSSNPYLDTFTAVQQASKSVGAWPDLSPLKEPLAWDDLADSFRLYDNPLFPNSFGKASTARSILTQAYAWAVPNDEALDAIAALGPIVEIGAGTGYWASLLAQRGVTVHAYDIAPRPLSYHPVQQGDAHAVTAHPDAALMLCWPPYAEPLADDALTLFQGDTVVYIGEGEGGCTGDDAFHERLDSEWTLESCISIPQWGGLHDRLYIYRRDVLPTLTAGEAHR